MKKICKNCKWWGSEEIYPAFPKFRSCSNAKFIDFWTLEDEDNEDLLGDEILMPLDGSMTIGPNFGCIHFEEKEDL